MRHTHPCSTRVRYPHRRSWRQRVRGGTLCLGLVSAAAHAAVSCSVSTPGLAFGAYDVFAASAVSGAGTVSVTCSTVPAASGTANYTISLSTGRSNSFVQRQMQGSGYTLNYNLYTSNTYSVVWGDGSGATSTVKGTIKLTKANPSEMVNSTVYGQIPALQDTGVSPSYVDSITVTVSY